MQILLAETVTKVSIVGLLLAVEDDGGCLHDREVRAKKRMKFLQGRETDLVQIAKGNPIRQLSLMIQDEQHDKESKFPCRRQGDAQ